MRHIQWSCDETQTNLSTNQSILKASKQHSIETDQIVYIAEVSHESYCTGTLLNRINTAQLEGMGDVRIVAVVQAGTSSPMSDHKGFKLQ